MRLIRGVPDGGGLGEFFFFVELAQGLDASFVTPEEVGIVAGQCAAGMGQALEVVGGRLGGVAQGDAQNMGVNQSLRALVRLALEDGGFGSVGAGGGWLSESWHVNGDRLVCPSDDSVFDGRTPTGAVLGDGVDSKGKTMIWWM